MTPPKLGVHEARTSDDARADSPQSDGFWTGDSLRAKVKSMVEGQYGIAMARIMSHPDFSKLIDLETAALTRYDGLMYIEAVHKICSEYTRRGLPEPTPYIAPANRRLATENVFILSALSQKAQHYINQVGLGAERYAITQQCEKAYGGNEAAYFVELAFAIHERKDKGWREAIITRIDVDNKGWSWRQADNSEFKHTGRINDSESALLLDSVAGLREVQPNHSREIRLKVFYKNQSNGVRNMLMPTVHHLEIMEEIVNKVTEPTDKQIAQADADLLEELVKNGAALTDELTGKPLDETPARPESAPKPERKYGELWRRLNNMYANLLPEADQTDPARHNDIHALLGVTNSLKELPDDLTDDAICALLQANILARKKAQEIAASATPHERVAMLLKDAFPLSTPVYKQNFFEQISGHKSIGGALAAMTEEMLFAKLRDAIHEAKGNESNLPPAQEPETAQDSERPAALSGLSELPPDPPMTKSEPQSAIVLSSAPTPEAVSIAVGVAQGYVRPGIPRSLQIMSTEAGARLIDLARSVASSKMYPGVDTLDKAIVIMWKGVELGIEPFAALEGIHIIKGKPSLSANLMLSLANSSGLIRDIRIVATNEWCEVTMWRKDRSESHTERFTIEDAKIAGLYNKKTQQGEEYSLWPKYPKSMCKARAISNCFKAVCPELAMGIRGVADDDEQDEDKLLARELAVA